MASFFNLFLLSFAFAFIIRCIDSAEDKPRAFILPIRKDNVTLKYYTTVDIGTPLTYPDLVIDLGGQILWFNCENGFNSSTYRPVRCGSSKCKVAKGSGCVGCNGTPRPGCTNNTCGVSPYNPFSNLLYAGGLGEDTMAIYETDGRFYLSHIYVPRLLFACGFNDQLQGLSNGTQGMIGLARTQVALQTQLSSAYKIQNKFALCLPSSSEDGLGDIFIGGGPYYMPPYTKDASTLLIKTPLIINPVSTAPVYSEGEHSDEYFINVKAIKINGKVLSLNTSLLSIDKKGAGGTKISTITPYTTLHSAIYKALVKEFVKKAASKWVTRVGPVAPFGECFSAKNIRSTKTGPAVPTIVLVLEGNRKYWNIYGGNSMVRVKKNVLCLGFIDGGSNPRTSIVLGGHQLEDNLLEFDLASSTFGRKLGPNYQGGHGAAQRALLVAAGFSCFWFSFGSPLRFALGTAGSMRVGEWLLAWKMTADLTGRWWRVDSDGVMWIAAISLMLLVFYLCCSLCCVGLLFMSSAAC
ncbi:hypothetical protein Pint_24900 [Pistacia integerrima]|uniref:Uncharacterized protein n=1 Tax=Pistacia integerrima TaxID=434235 RepID=A0ACC0YFU9_9ROSI|nr:hypothetical protein Pint_24900 [Pistacia integerrima]